MERLNYFTLEGVVKENGQQSGEPARYTVILVSLIGCQRVDISREVLPSASDGGLTPAMVREIVYQSVDYTGIERICPFLSVTNEVLGSREIPPSPPGQTITIVKDRLKRGSQVQVDVFNEGMRDFWKERHVNRWLAANCFGDYYTHRGLDFVRRELTTPCLLAVQGGYEPQLTSHAAANIRLGDTKEHLMKVISQYLPYIDYPHSLNAVACVEKV